MKITTIILAFYFCFLTVQPVMRQIYSAITHHTEICEQDCCAKKHTESSKQEKNNCCHNGVCNPICPCCFFFISYSAFELKRFSIQFKLIPITYNKLVSGFLFDCFHPPEIV